MMQRVVVLVDGFNLYHALDSLGKPWVKWLDLWALSQRLSRPKSEQVTAVYYFTALAYWLPEQAARHRIYIKALEAKGVIPVLGKFKEKYRSCKQCGAKWMGHEEKETDVNIAVHLLRLATHDKFDRCIIVSRDSDLVPAIKSAREENPGKVFTMASPPNFGQGTELIQAAGDKCKISLQQVEECLLESEVFDASGQLVARIPEKYIKPDEGET